jgi:hypothetical protein
LLVVCAAIFVPREEEKYYDLAGALGFLTTTAVSLYYPVLKTKILHDYHTPLPPLSSFAYRQLLLCTALGIWSVRLGGFLFSVRETCFTVFCFCSLVNEEGIPGRRRFQIR